MNKTSYHIHLLILACLFIASPLNAIEKITVYADRFKNDWLNTNKSNDIVDLPTTPFIHPDELLNKSPGIQIQRGASGLESLSAIRSPVLTGGAGAGSTLFLLDGVPLRSPLFGNANGFIEAPIEMSQSILINKGPSDIYDSWSAPHGSYNFISPRFASPRFRLSLGSFEFNEIHASAGLKNHIFSANSKKSNSWRKNSSFTQYKFFYGSDYELTDLLDLRLNYYFQRYDQKSADYILGLNAYKDETLIKENGVPSAYRDTQSHHLNAHIDLSLNNKTSLDLDFFARYTQMDFILHFLPGKAREKNDHHSLGFMSHLEHRFNQNVTTYFGIDFERTNGELKEYQEEDTVFSYIQGDHYHFQVKTNFLTLFQLTELKLWPDIVLSGGVRYQLAQYDYDNLISDGDFGRFRRLQDRKNEFSSSNPQFSIKYHKSKYSRFFMNIHQVSRMLQTSDLYRLQTNQTQDRILPERINSYEVGHKLQKGSFKFSSSIFFMEKENFYFRDAEGSNVTDGKTSHKGIEVSYDHLVHKNWSILVSNQFAIHQYEFNHEINTSNLSSETISQGDDVDTAPRLISFLEITRIDGSIKNKVSLRRISSYKTSADNQNSYPGHSILNYEFTHSFRKWSYAIKVNNLLDTQFASRADYFSENHRYFPGQPRSFFISASKDF